MASKIVAQRVRGVLTDANGKTYNVQFDLKLIAHNVDEEEKPVRHTLDSIALASSDQHLPDGIYALSYDGGPPEKKYKVKGGELRAG